MFMSQIKGHIPLNAFPIPYAAPAAIAPIIIVSGMEMYHGRPPTRLLQNPRIAKNNIEIPIVAQIIVLFRWVSP